MGKYEPLPQFLSTKPGATHRMSFEQIERVLGFKLPKSAYEHEAWWSNNATGHSHSRTWLAAGWRTQEVDLEARKVTFQRSAFEAQTRSLGLHGWHGHNYAGRRPYGPYWREMERRGRPASK
jgi:hypothetical protein